MNLKSKMQQCKKVKAVTRCKMISNNDPNYIT